jgi:hypothetical protein
MAEWFKAPVLTKSAAADLGREPADQVGERSDAARTANMLMACLPQNWRDVAPNDAVRYFAYYGWVAEWFKAPVLKTGVAETLP